MTSHKTCKQILAPFLGADVDWLRTAGVINNAQSGNYYFVSPGESGSHASQLLQWYKIQQH